VSFGYEIDFVRRRYDYLASTYPLINLLFWLPLDIRARVVGQLELKPGDKVLEVGLRDRPKSSSACRSCRSHRTSFWRRLLRRDVGKSQGACLLPSGLAPRTE